MRNVLIRVFKRSAEMVAAAIRTIYAQPTAQTVRAQLATIATMLGRQFPVVEQMLIDAADDITAFAGCPQHASARPHQTPRVPFPIMGRAL